MANRLIRTTARPLSLTILLTWLTTGFAATAPYPPSPVISGITWDYSSLQHAAQGSDLWPMTWADDGNLYASWGDGGGFGGSNTLGRVSLGVARISGGATSWQGTNVFGGYQAAVPATFDGKSGGLIAINHVLYMSVTQQDTWTYGKVCQSTDYAKTWACTGWDWTRPFNGLAFLTYGQDYAGSPDSYVYAYNDDSASAVETSIVLARVPANQIMNRSAYQFFAGLDSSGNPIWSSDITQYKPAFTDPNGVTFGVRVTYDPGIKRYLLTMAHGSGSGWGMFDAPNPWGPWTTVAYYSSWIDSVPKFGFGLTQKWMSANGTGFEMVFSGLAPYDAWNTISGTFQLVPLAAPAGPPPAPSGLRLNVSP
ncbi:MAG: hypothetical protein B7Z66_08080 [Chromatiales bacterium 21-64-14]|nr:MAG: hypothetical protein B7Z66_08080 [Chromatiales bacterium 21-64-14]HQU16062.1 DUF4185 domain-containing protein [Gammaproteobacteria bacterium]